MPDQPQTPETPGTTETPEDHPQAAGPRTPDAPAQPEPARRSALAAALPFITTAAAAVLVSVLVQAMLWPRQPSQPPVPTAAPVATATAEAATPEAQAPTAAPAASPAPTQALSEESVLSLQILDLEDENRRLWSAIYLLRAASQIDDSITALEGNDIAEADRTLLAVYRSLDRAYAFSAEQEKGPIDTFRLELSSIRDDLRVRPEGADRRLRQLRQLMLSLVDEGG